MVSAVVFASSTAVNAPISQCTFSGSATSGGGAPSTVAPLCVPDRRPEDLPAYSGLAERADQPGVAVSGNQVGLVDSFREGGRSIERSIAGRRLHQFTRPSANICRG